MYGKSKVIAVILARGGSKGIPKKNIYTIAGHPLISYTIAAALQSKYIDELVVSTDSVEIAEVARGYGAKTPFMRPAELAGDTTLSVDALHHAVLEAEEAFGSTYDYIIELPCVCPLRDSSDIDGALEKLFQTGANSVISVVNTGEKHPIRMKRIVNDQIADFCTEYPEPAKGSRRQDFEACFIRNGAIYSMTRATLVDQQSRHGRDSRPYIMPDKKSVNVDCIMDLRIAEILINEGYCNNIPQKIKIFHIETFGSDKEFHFLVTAPLHFIPKMRAKIIDETHCTFAYGADKQTVISLVKDATAWMCSPCPSYQIDGEILRHATKLKVLGTPSTGTNHIDKDYCEKHGIKVACLRGTDFVNSIHASSEFTFAILIAAMRKIPYAYQEARWGVWREREDDFRGVELNGKTVGIIGYGRIGANLARYADSFRMKVVAYDPYVTITDDYTTQVGSPEEVLTQGDVIAICVHLDEGTRGMVSESWFSQMKEGVYFVNTARGEIVDETALLSNLTSGKIIVAATDVISNEQIARKSTHPIIQYARTHDNLIVTPHIAGLTFESEHKATQFMYESIKRELIKNAN